MHEKVELAHPKNEPARPKHKHKQEPAYPKQEPPTVKHEPAYPKQEPPTVKHEPAYPKQELVSKADKAVDHHGEKKLEHRLHKKEPTSPAAKAKRPSSAETGK